MARSRNIKPGFFKNDLLAEINPLGRLLFAGLWAIADRSGRLHDRVKRIKAEVLPYDDVDVDRLLMDLAVRGFITRYVAGGMELIQINNWSKHQNPSKKEAVSQLPPVPVEHQLSIVQVLDFPTTNSADSLILIPDVLIPDVLITDSLNPEEPAAALGPDEPMRKGFKDPVFADLVKAYEQNIRPMTPMEAEILIEWYCRVEPGVIKMAMGEAVNNGVRNMKYIAGILKAWAGTGATTVAAVEAHQKDFQDKKNKGKGPPGGGKGPNKFHNFEGRLSGLNDDELTDLIKKRKGASQGGSS